MSYTDITILVSVMGVCFVYIMYCLAGSRYTNKYNKLIKDLKSKGYNNIREVPSK